MESSRTRRPPLRRLRQRSREWQLPYVPAPVSRQDRLPVAHSRSSRFVEVKGITQHVFYRVARHPSQESVQARHCCNSLPLGLHAANRAWSVPRHVACSSLEFSMIAENRGALNSASERPGPLACGVISRPGPASRRSSLRPAVPAQPGSGVAALAPDGQRNRASATPPTSRSASPASTRSGCAGPGPQQP